MEFPLATQYPCLTTHIVHAGCYFVMILARKKITEGVATTPVTESFVASANIPNPKGAIIFYGMGGGHEKAGGS